MDYKLLSYQTAQGVQAGLLVEGHVFALAELTGRAEDSTVLEVLTDWPSRQGRLDQAAQRAALAPSSGQPLDKVILAAPVLYPSAIYCAGANYRDHAREMAQAAGRPEGPDPRAGGRAPWHFLKPSRTVVANHQPVQLPRGSKTVDWEVELAAVIGRLARDVSVDEALDYVAGYTVANDLSARDLSRRAGTAESSPFYFDWLGHKVFDGSCPLGPWITPAHQLGDPQALKLGLTLNGVVKQDSSTSEMIFTIAEQIAYLSSRRTLYPGDLVLTGTPAGVGAGRGEFLKAGDVIEAWVEGVGSLVTPITDSAPLGAKPIRRQGAAQAPTANFVGI